MTVRSQEIQVELASGQVNLVVLSCHNWGRLSRLIIRDLEESGDGFTFAIYDRRDAINPAGVTTTTTVNPNDDRDLVDPVIHRIYPETTEAGNLHEMYQGDYHFQNRDELSPNGVSNNHAIYLEITPAGGGGKTFAISYTVNQPSF